MKTWADAAGIIPPAASIDRDAGDGPPRCCNRRLVAADALVCYDEADAVRLALILDRLLLLRQAPNVFLCDACADLIVREQLVTREERALDLKLSAELVEKARAHDQLLRGVELVGGAPAAPIR